MEQEEKATEKVYYQKSTGFVCYRFPNDYEPESEDDFIEVPKETADETRVCPYGKVWAIDNGEPVLIDDEKIINSDEYKTTKLKEELSVLKRYLADTDYVVTKLNELSIEGGDEHESAKKEYADTLAKRKEARKRINEIQAGLA